MVSSSVITVTADGECLTCNGFSLGEAIHLGNFEFIADYFDGLSLPPPKRSDARIAYMASTHKEASTSRWATIEHSAVEFLTASSGEGFVDQDQLERFLAKREHNNTHKYNTIYCSSSRKLLQLRFTY
jgi:hypothetical protein